MLMTRELLLFIIVIPTSIGFSWILMDVWSDSVSQGHCEVSRHVPNNLYRHSLLGITMGKLNHQSLHPQERWNNEENSLYHACLLKGISLGNLLEWSCTSGGILNILRAIPSPQLCMGCCWIFMDSRWIPWKSRHIEGLSSHPDWKI